MIADKIRNLAENKLREGKTMQQIFQELKKELKTKSKNIAKALQYVPTLQKRKDHKVAHIILLVFLIIGVLLRMVVLVRSFPEVSSIMFISPLLQILLAYGVFTYRAQFYRVMGVLGAISLLFAFLTFILFDIITAGLITFLGFYLYSNMISRYETKGEVITFKD